MSRVKQTSRNALKRKRDEDDQTATAVTKKTAASPFLLEDADERRDGTINITKNAPRPSKIEGLNDAIGDMDNSLLADYFAQQIKRHLGDLSTVELDKKYLPSKAFLNTSEFEQRRNLATLPAYIEQFTPAGIDELRGPVETNSTPHTLFVASSGIRAADLTRALRVFQSDKSAVAKLFAKHIKLVESIDYVKKTRIGIGVGTPARIQDLIKAEALKTSNLNRIVIDGSYVDQKKRSIFDMKEIFVPLLEFVSHKTLKKRYEDGILQQESKPLTKHDSSVVFLSLLLVGIVLSEVLMQREISRKQLAPSFTTTASSSSYSLPPFNTPITPAQLDAAFQRCLQLQNAGVTLHSKRPFAALLLAPDKTTVLLSHLSISHVQHAEAELARLASIHYSQSYLWDCTLVSTWEPCAMCTGTIYWANIGRLVYAASEVDLNKLTGAGNGENMTMSLPCREVLKGGQKAVEVLGPVKPWDERVINESGKWWREHLMKEEKNVNGPREAEFDSDYSAADLQSSIDWLS